MVEYAYLGVAGCGCALGVVVDNPIHAKEVRREVSKFLREGLVIERATVGEAGARLCVASHRESCPHPQECPELIKLV